MVLAKDKYCPLINNYNYLFPSWYENVKQKENLNLN